MLRSVISVVGAAALAMAPMSASYAGAVETPSVQEQVDAALAAVPGGTQVDANTVVWYGGQMILDVEGPFSTQSVGSCATGNFCAYGGLNLTGTKLSFTTCGTFSTAAISLVRSIANARSTNNVQARNSSATVLATLAPGGFDNSAPTGIASMRCVP